MNSESLATVWTALSQSSLFNLTLTMMAYLVSIEIYKRCNYSTWASPTFLTIVLVAIFLIVTRIPYPRFFEGAQFIHFLLGPATVALAVPLYHHRKRLAGMIVPLLAALLAGSAVAAGSAMLIAEIFGASREIVLSLAPKSVTTPIAMGIAERIGGIPSLTAVFVVITGTLGAVGFSFLFKLMKSKDAAAEGFAVGLAAHGFGTARAFLVSEEMGAFSALGMGLNGILSAIALPLILG
jgi:predicted murein hydrolase (TIGR00659 family)